MTTHDWKITQVISITDGDTVRLHLVRTSDLDNEFDMDIRTKRERRGIAIRLIILDTPEKGQVGYLDAKANLGKWLDLRATHLRVETYASAGWDRLLGDIYVEGSRGDTATQYMLQAGWNVYTGPKGA